jgi:hypothetical protein
MESKRELPSSVPVAWAHSRAARVRHHARKRFFLKKEAKFLLFGIRAGRGPRLELQKFFGSFFQKRTDFFTSPPK